MFDPMGDWLPQYVKLEISLGSYAFPTQIVEIQNYIGDYLEMRGKKEYAGQFCLDRFNMNLQSLDRTYIDKVFTLCDYYLQGKSKRYSRHLYDIYKLKSYIKYDEDFIALIQEVREHRSKLSICPYAQENIDILTVILEFCDNDFYVESSIQE